MITIELPYLSKDKSWRSGKTIYNVRFRGHKIRIREEPGTPEFAKAYADALEAIQKAPPIPKKPSAEAPIKRRSFGWLAKKYFASAEFKALYPSSRATRRNVIEECLQHSYKGRPMRDCPLRLMTPKKIKILRDAKNDIGLKGAANNRRKYLSPMYGWAVEENLMTTNPARDVKRLKYPTRGFHTWTVAEVKQYIAHWPLGTKQHLALALMLFLGLRRGDVVKVGSQHESEGILEMIPSKTAYIRLATSYKPILPVLAAVLAASPKGPLTYLLTEYGKPFTPAGFGNWFANACNLAKLPHCRAHGLRKAGATIAAENGATIHQLMAIYDWSTPGQAMVYTEAADRKRLAISGMPLLIAKETL